MTKTRTVHVVGGDPDVSRMFANAGWSCWEQDPDLVCFTGGVDVSPELYCQPHQGAYGCNPHRDLVEVGQFLKYMYKGVPMVGICRGAQFLNVMFGGSLIQHIPGHNMRKAVVKRYTVAGDLLDTGAAPRTKLHEDHHQGIVPNGVSDVVLAVDANDGNVEIVLSFDPFDQPHLLFQAHPEWGHEGTRKLFFDLIEEHLM